MPYLTVSWSLIENIADREELLSSYMVAWFCSLFLERFCLAFVG